MALRAALAFSVSGFLVLVLGAMLRAFARRNRRRWPRTSAGVVFVVAIPVGLLMATAVPDRALAVCAGALAMALLGWVRDRRSVPTWVTGVVTVAVAIAVASSGVRFPLGGVPAVDFVWTVVWLTLVTTAVANAGNADGQFVSVTSASVLGIVAIAAFGLQSAAASLSAALLGTLLAFLAYNARPASLYTGRVGTLFASFLVAAGALWARPSVGRPESLLVTLLLVAVPLLDGLVVVLSRLRRGRPLGVRIRDHLSHRLVAGGFRPTRTIVLLMVVQLACCVLAVFAGRNILSIPVTAALAFILLLGLTILAMRARMRDETRPEFSWRVRLAAFAIIGFVVVASAIAAASAFSTRTKLLAARDRANAAIHAANEGDSARAMTLFAEAERDFAAADDRLGSIVNVPSLIVPVVGSNMHAARELTRVGLELSRAGHDLTEQINSDQLHLVDGRIPLDSVAEVAPELDDAARILARSKKAIDDLPRSYLVGELKDGVHQLRADLSDAAHNATTAAEAARVAPQLLGDGGPRRYLLLVQNPAELRGTGGLVGNWGILSAENGDIRLDSLERLQTLNAARRGQKKLHAPQDYVDRYGQYDPAGTFQNANMSPDFPTAAAVMADVYEQSFDTRVDGVLAVDPLGLQALLQLTGPVRVPDWRVPITAENVVDTTLRDAYQAFARTPERADFLGDVARAAIDRATSGDLGSLSEVSRVLGKSAHEGHFLLWLDDAKNQQIVDAIGIGGRLMLPRGDSLHVSNTNASANKLDYYLERAISYSVQVTPSPDLRRAIVTGSLAVDLTNDAPASGLPQIVAGPYEGALNEFVYGQNRTLLSVYSPLEVLGARVADKPVETTTDRELDRNVFSRFLDIFVQKSEGVDLDVSGTVALADGGWYELTLFRQPTLRPDPVHVRIAVPAGFRIRNAPGLEVHDGVAEGDLALDRTRTVRVKIGAATSANLWDRLRAGS